MTTRLVLFRSLPLVVLLLSSQSLMAQQSVEMADQLRSDGKIWVVVAVVAIVFFGIITYLVRLDTKISKLEREVRDGQPHAFTRSPSPADRSTL